MGAAKGAGAIGTTPLSTALDLVTSCSATDWPAELDGGPGGSDAVGARARCVDHGVAWTTARTGSGSDAESAGNE